ncbi:MAG TPA: hypothetical protein VFH30_15455 [Acidimicrobiales bacterium]|nr:hypothetical protein [Acidimicrobiales bacterium]
MTTTQTTRLTGALVAAVLVAACSGDDGGDRGEAASATTAQAPATIVLSTEGNNLNAYEPDPPFRKQTVIRTAADDPDGLDINGQVCMVPDGSGRQLFVAGEDTGQPERTPGWGIFELEGGTVGDLEAREVGRLVPTYQTEGPENYGCGVLSDGRIVTTDIGNQVTGPPTGQLIVWFPPFDTDEVPYCKIDVALPTPGGIHVVDDVVYLAAARPPGNGIVRYDGPFPTSADAAGGCGRVDGTGAPLADEADKGPFIPADEHVATPNAVVGAPGGGFYVSSAFTGVLAEYDDSGHFVRTLVTPPPGEQLGAEPYSTGAPIGMGVDPTTGSLYWADLAIGITDSIGPIDGAGTVRRITFDADGNPRPPETLDEGLDFPDGIGIYVPADA